MAYIKKIISGGQTGVDQAALKAGLDLGYPVGGWCPPGRLCENGTIPGEYPLKETEKDRSDLAPDVPRSRRTEFNVRYSDATLIFRPQGLNNDPGTEYNIRFAEIYNKPFLIIDPYAADIRSTITDWLTSKHIDTLNIAGPSEKKLPGINKKVYEILLEILSGNQ